MNQSDVKKIEKICNRIGHPNQTAGGIKLFVQVEMLMHYIKKLQSGEQIPLDIWEDEE